jgi:putative Ca2+/H+ antiporter (TMEM165/GDT1 family)
MLYSLKIIFNSTLLVALTEMGDKTQLLAFILASKYKKPWSILAGILVATVLNHMLAAYIGVWISNVLPENVLKWFLAILFIGFAIWIMIPDKAEEVETNQKYGPFLTTAVLFFLAEMGDKTQLATVTLAAKYDELLLVTMGTTLGMMLTDGPAVFFGDKMAAKIPLKWIHVGAAILYVAFAIGILIH